MVLWQLTTVFGLLSLLSFGGGNAIVPQMYADSVVAHHWVDATEFARFFALGRLAPGPTMNMSALIGYATAGFAGALVAAAALFVPAGLIVYVLGRMWRKLHGNAWRDRIASGFAPVVAGLIWAGIPPVAGGSISLQAPATIAIAVAAAVLMLATKVNQALVVLGAGVLGFVLFR
jgi:chromate transporter